MMLNRPIENRLEAMDLPVWPGYARLDRVIEDREIHCFYTWWKGNLYVVSNTLDPRHLELDDPVYTINRVEDDGTSKVLFLEAYIEWRLERLTKLRMDLPHLV